MSNIIELLRAYITANQEEMIRKLGELVNLEGHFLERENVVKARNWLQKELEVEGFECNVIELEPNERAGTLVAVLGKDRPGKPVQFSGHVDTVHYTGSFGKENHFYVKDGVAYGPGVLDMKGGLIIALYAVKALNAIGYKDRPIRMIVMGDEEYDHIDNNADVVQREASRGALCSFHMESGTSGKLVTARKSQDTYHIEVKGTGGHAGRDFWIKKNPLHELLPKLTKMISLTNKDKETTVTIAVVKAGEHWCSIPDYAEAYIDVRFLEESEAERVRKGIETFAEEVYVPGTETIVTRQRANFRALVENDTTLKFFNFLNEVAVECGQNPREAMMGGGADDAGTIHSAGVAVVDGCGIDGINPHNLAEQAYVQSLFDKVLLISSAIYEIGRLETNLANDNFVE